MRSTAQHDGDPLAARVRKACQVLDVGKDKLYELIAEGEVESYLDDGIRKITFESMRRYIKRKLEAPTAATPARIRKLRQLRNQPPAA